LQIIVRLGKCRVFEAKNSEDFKLSVDKINQRFLLQNSTITRTGTLSSRLQVSFRQSAFGVFLLGMRPISRTGHQRSFRKFLVSNSTKEEKVFISLGKFLTTNPTILLSECWKRKFTHYVCKNKNPIFHIANFLNNILSILFFV
jgi:hypothetical protein